MAHDARTARHLADRVDGDAHRSAELRGERQGGRPGCGRLQAQVCADSTGEAPETSFPVPVPVPLSPRQARQRRDQLQLQLVRRLAARRWAGRGRQRVQLLHRAGLDAAPWGAGTAVRCRVGGHRRGRVQDGAATGGRDDDCKDQKPERCDKFPSFSFPFRLLKDTVAETRRQVNSDGGQSASAWWEWYPEAAYTIEGLEVKPGDWMSVNISATDATSGTM